MADEFLSFSALCKFLKTGQHDSRFLESVDRFLGILLIFSPAIFGLSMGDVTPAFGLLAVKNELTSLARQMVEIFDKHESSIDSRHERMRIAHNAIAYTSFFEALDVYLPELWNSFVPQGDLKTHLLQTFQATKQSRRQPAMDKAPVDSLLELPHPANSFEQYLTTLRRHYSDLSRALFELLKDLKIAVPENLKLEGAIARELKAMDPNDQQERREHLLKEALKTLDRKIGEAATKYFEVQYYELCVRYPEFYTWANLAAHRRTEVAFGLLNDHLRATIAAV